MTQNAFCAKLFETFFFHT